MQTPRTMRTSILVSTYNWPKALELSIKSMFNQTMLPDEIVIADDGSDVRTKRLVSQLQKESPIPIVHVWQEDRGFRRTEILNKAIAAAHCEYILQVDGDVILASHFVHDHVDIAQKGYFVCGSRVKLNPHTTDRVLSKGLSALRFWDIPLGYAPNCFRSHILRHLLSERYARDIDHLRGCNMAFWRDDLLKVNGYNEDLTQWGHEDGELAYRLHFAGIKKKVLKMGGVVYHLYHEDSSRSNESIHLQALERVKNNHLKWCKNGIDKYTNDYFSGEVNSSPHLNE